MGAKSLARFGVLVALCTLSWQTQAACVTAAPGTAQWQNQGFASQSGVFSFHVSAQPQTANGDTLVALSNGAKTNWSGLAAIVRFNSANQIDVRDGNIYRADQGVRYYPGWTYNLRFDVDVPNKRYSVFYNYPGDVSYHPLANNYAFRTEQQGVTSLNNFVAEAEVGGMYACPSAPRPWKTATAGVRQWVNSDGVGIRAPGTYILKFRVRPSAANADLLLALANGPQTTWTGLAAIVRFNRNNTIDVRDGGTYRADAVVPYQPNQTYDVTMLVYTTEDGSPWRYTVSVGPSHVPQSSTTIASNYRFRTEQQNVTQLTHWVLEAEVGGISGDLVDRELN